MNHEELNDIFSRMLPVGPGGEIEIVDAESGELIDEVQTNPRPDIDDLIKDPTEVDPTQSEWSWWDYAMYGIPVACAGAIIYTMGSKR